MSVPSTELSWNAPAGVRTEKGGLEASFKAMGLRSVVEPDAGGVRFEAWKSPRVTGSVAAALLASIAYLALDHWGATPFQTFVAVVVIAYYVPLWIVPSYRISGRVAREEGSEHARLSLSLTSRGLLARPARMESVLRFYLA